MARYGQIWPDMARYCQMWPDMAMRVPEKVSRPGFYFRWRTFGPRGFGGPWWAGARTGVNSP
jgi:hypothetical protein